MKRLLVLTTIVATTLIAFPRAQGRIPVFTIGTTAELALAQDRGMQRLRGIARQRGIADDLVVSKVSIDRRSMAHTRVQQLFRGIRVLGGEAIAHFTSDGEPFADTDDLLPNISVNTTPGLSPADAISVAVGEYGCRDCLTASPSADLWILRDEGVDRLVYRVQLQRLDGTPATALPVIFVDAHGGFVVSRYDNLQSGTGLSLYSGTVDIGTHFSALHNDYVLENHTLRVGTFDLLNPLLTFRDADDVWDGPTQRAGVDAQFAMEQYFAYLSAEYGRNGIDGSGGPFTLQSEEGAPALVSSLVHFGTNFNNAGWDPVNTFMIYGDGDGVQFAPLVTIDVGGHEMTHGVTQFTAGLIYQGEPGALNEAWSDVFGAMFERYVKGVSTNNWLIAEEAFTPGVAGDALRFMDDPHRASNKGFTANDDPDHYSERYAGTGDNGGVHINSGIANKAFYLLAQGGSHHVGGSMTGIGADAAAGIWFSALMSYMTSNTDFAGARVATMNAAAAIYGPGSTEHKAVSKAWCLVGVGVCAPPTADSVTPNAGSGSTQLFELRYSDPQGATNLAKTWVWFSANLAQTATNSCMAHYSRPDNALFLLNDQGTAWTSGTPGSGGVLQNSQCSISLASSSVITSGNTLVLKLAVTFTTLFSGAKNIFMYAENVIGENSGWQDRGDWTVPPSLVAAVTADSVTPSSGSGTTQTFTLQYSDSLGATDVFESWVWFNATFASNAATSCLAYYNRPANTVFLLNDAGTVWMSGAMSSGATLQNSQCAIALAASGATPDGNVLTVSLAVTFKATFHGAKNVYMFARNAGGINSGWQDRGDWTVPGLAVTTDSVTPSSGSGTTQLFALQYSDSLGASDLSQVWVWFTATFAQSAASSCLAYYEPASNAVFLLNDAATGWMAAPLGSPTMLQNSQCSITLAASAANASGNTLTVSLAMTFKQAFAGAKNVFMYAASLGGANSGWHDRGDWTIPGAGVTADSVTPGSGSGATQTFALAYSSSLGATDLSQTWVWFNATFAGTAASSCLVYYDRPANTLFLLNDVGTTWMPAVLGSGTELQNSQCSIATRSSTVSPNGNTLTVNLAVTFSSSYSGTKKVFLYATNGAINSGWQDRGDWMVP